MALYINEDDLIRRLETGNVPIKGEPCKYKNLYKANSIELTDLGVKQVLKVVFEIVASMEDTGIKLYPREACGAKIKHLRIQKGYSINHLARNAGLNRSVICRAESGKCIPTREHLNKMAQALGVDPEDLIKENDIYD